MQTLKLKYTVEDEQAKAAIAEYVHQYNSLFKFVYNRTKDGLDQKQIKAKVKEMNNVDKMNSWFVQTAIYDVKSFSGKDKVIFGGKKLFLKRNKGQISREEFLENRLLPLSSIGCRNNVSYKGNRFFRIDNDLKTVTFQPSRHEHFSLILIGVGNRMPILKDLFLRQEQKDLTISYKLSKDHIWISFDEKELYTNKITYKGIENRVMAVDINPNYVGWSIVDWKSSSEFEVVKSGVVSIKTLNDIEKEFKDKRLSSDSKERIWLSNKRRYETLQISKKLINIALHYKVQLFGIEELNIKSSDKELGKNFNRLCNNNWNRNALTNSLNKRCNIFGIKLLEVKPNYSSFVGNFLFRSLNLPDMTLASIEIGRRTYEFYNQYITKKKIIKKNIIQPYLSDFKDFYLKSLEEFKLKDGYKDLVELYYYIKNSKIMYRVSIDSLKDFIVFRHFSYKTLVAYMNF